MIFLSRDEYMFGESELLPSTPLRVYLKKKKKQLTLHDNDRLKAHESTSHLEVN